MASIASVPLPARKEQERKQVIHLWGSTSLLVSAQGACELNELLCHNACHMLRLVSGFRQGRLEKAMHLSTSNCDLPSGGTTPLSLTTKHQKRLTILGVSYVIPTPGSLSTSPTTKRKRMHSLFQQSSISFLIPLTGSLSTSPTTKRQKNAQSFSTIFNIFPDSPPQAPSAPAPPPSAPTSCPPTAPP